jgi:polyisoprenyl-phosphate glycosyltransferase
MNVRSLTIVTPVLDDWEAFQRLVANLNAGLEDVRVHVLAVDDGSNTGFDPARLKLSTGGAVAAVTIVRLALNLGHQRAIAVGLTDAARGDADAVLVMDSDGEDRPEDVPKLLADFAAAPDSVILAQRAKRSEALTFRIGLAIYKALFRLLTGQRIDFGNFSLLPIAAVRRLTHTPDLWNNLAAAVMRSRLPCRRVPIERGKRYHGESKMNWVALVLHGLSALSVYSEVIFVRMLFVAAAVGGLAVIGIAAAVAIRLATQLAVPGWTTTVVGVFLIVLIQMLLAVIVTSLLMLSGRSRRLFVPKTDCEQFIARRDRVAPAER